LKYFKMYWRYIGQQLKQAMVDRGDFMVGFITILTYQGLGLAFIGVVFLNVPEIRGWRFAEILFILGFFHVTSGLFYMHFSWTIWFARHYILGRELDRLLIRPLDPYFQVMAEGLGSSMQEIFSCILGVIMMVIAAGLLQIHWTLDKVLWIFLGVILGVIILGGFFTLLAASSFWVVGSTSLASPLMSFMEFAQYPLEIYSRALRLILTFVIPLGFIAFYPSAGVLRAGYQVYMLLAAALALLLGGGGYSLWRLGLKRYQSAGH